MNEVVGEWVSKAEGDCVTALREFRARRAPNYDAACFHAQQCIEKYLKALLQLHEISFSKTHHLPLLLDQCLPFAPTWEWMLPELTDLSRYAVQFRYPGESADRTDAKRAVDILLRVRHEARASLSLPSEGRRHSTHARPRTNRRER